MNVKIETYRGIEIIFMTDSERFSYSFDIGKYYEKQSYAACKKSIDDYLKENAKFEPFKVQKINSGEIVTILGIRKDNRFIFENNGIKEQLSDYEEKYYIEILPENQEYYSQLKALEKQRDDISKLEHLIRSKIMGTTLRELKSKYKQP